jgi:hypothetical protein
VLFLNREHGRRDRREEAGHDETLLVLRLRVVWLEPPRPGDGSFGSLGLLKARNKTSRT